MSEPNIANESSGEFLPGSKSTDPANITLVVNPGAGRGRARRMLPRVCAELLIGIPEAHLRVYQAASYAEAQQRMITAVKTSHLLRPGHRSDTLIVMGGDGMAHLGLNACVKSEVTLGIIPAGTGNDFCRGIGIPANIVSATRTIIDGHTRCLDLAAVCGNMPGIQPRYVGSVVSSGYDARVNRRANAVALPLGPLAYGYIALSELASFKPLDYQLIVDGEKRELSAMLIAIGNSGYFGGGMNICPNYDLNDGLLDLTIVYPVSRMTMLKLLPKLYTGGFIKHPSIELLRAKQVQIAGKELFIMADGEELGSAPVRVGCEPQAVTVLTPRMKHLSR